jgi:propanol-preferring alcohol dehydrogenase
MKAMVLRKAGSQLLEEEVPAPSPGPHQVLVRIHACGVCRTDLHVIDGELTRPKLPLIPGHEIVGTIISKGKNTDKFQIGDRVGIPWLGM